MKVEPSSATWLAIKARLVAEIEQARNRLETTRSPSETDIERGKLLALRGLLAMGEDKSLPALGDVPHY